MRIARSLFGFVNGLALGALLVGCEGDGPSTSPDAAVEQDGSVDAGATQDGSACGAASCDAQVLVQDAAQEACPSVQELAASATAGLRVVQAANVTGYLFAAGSHLYFATTTGISRVPLAGGAPELVRADDKVDALTVTGDTLVWTHEYTDGNQLRRRLLKASLSAPQATPTELAADLGSYDGKLVSDGTSVFWTGDQPGVSKLSLTGGAVTVIAATTSAQDLEAFGNKLYMLDFNSDGVLEIPTDGSAPVRLAELFHGGDMEIDADNIYWADGSEGAINRWQRGTARKQVLSSRPHSSWPGSAALSSGVLYWREGRSCMELYSIDVGGGEARRVLRASDIGTLVADANGVYFATKGALYYLAR